MAKENVNVCVEVTIAPIYGVDVDKSEPGWEEIAVELAEQMARDDHNDVVSTNGEIND